MATPHAHRATTPNSASTSASPSAWTSTSTGAARPVSRIVHVGFAGTRELLTPAYSLSAPEIESLHAQIERQLAEQIRALRMRVEATSGSPALHAISQVARGADICFARACASCGVPLRVFLAQARDAYLDAHDEHGVGDFTPAERRAARELLDGVNVIEERVVATAAERAARFDEVTRAIAAASDVLIGLLRADELDGSLHTRRLLDLGRTHGKPVCELHLRRDGARATLDAHWSGASHASR